LQHSDESFDREARLKPALKAKYEASKDNRLKPVSNGANGATKGRKNGNLVLAILAWAGRPSAPMV